MREVSCLYFTGLDPFSGFERGTRRYSLWSDQNVFPIWGRPHKLSLHGFSQAYFYANLVLWPQDHREVLDLILGA